MSDEAALTPEPSAPPVEAVDPGETVVPEAPKPARSGKFAPEVLAKLAELRRSPQISDDVWVPGEETPPPKAAAKPAAPAPTAVTSSTPTPTATAPAPAPSEPAAPAVDVTAVIAERDALKAREQTLAEREAKIAEYEQRYGDVGAKIAADPYGSLRELARANLGTGASDAEIDAEVSDLITEASLKLAGASLDAKDEKAALRQLQREMRLTKAERRREQTSAAAAQKAAQEAQAKAERDAAEAASVKRAHEAIGNEWTTIKDGHAWLAAEDAPTELIWSLLLRHHERTGQVMTIADAAKKLDDELAATHRAKFQKLSHLLQPATAATQATANATGHQGDQPRRSRPLTNADASEDAAPPAPQGFQSLADMRAASRAKLRPLFAQLRDEAARRGD